MRSEILLWSIREGRLLQLVKGTFAEAHKEKDLEDWVEHNPSLLGRKLTMVGRQVYVPKVGLLDLLAVDEDGRLVVIEFKRQQSTRDTIAQILDYASAIRLMTIDQVKGLADVSNVDWGKVTDSDPALILVAADVDGAAQRIVEYLASHGQLPIEVVTFTYATLEDGQEIIARSILTPEPQAADAGKPGSKITFRELLSIAEERGVLESVEELHQVTRCGWSHEVFRNNGGQIRYWVKVNSRWRVIFGMYVGSEKFASPKGQLDVWIRPERVAEYTGSSLESLQADLRLFEHYRETDEAIFLRVADQIAASRLHQLLQSWSDLSTVRGEDTEAAE